MKVSDEFLKAKKDKELSHFMLVQRMERVNSYSNEMELKSCIRLIIQRSNGFNTDRQQITIDTDTEIKIDNYSGNAFGCERWPRTDITSIFFYIPVYHFTNYPDTTKTFLSAIKKDSEVSFQVIAFNSSESHGNVKFTNHKLIGIVDGKGYLLQEYTGPQNSASPVK